MVVNLDRFCQSVIKSRLAPREINLWLSISLFASLLVRKHISYVCIHTSMFKKRIYSVQKNISYIKKMFKKRIYTYTVFAFILQYSRREFTLVQLHMLGLNSHFHCSKREFVLFQKTYPLSWIHTSMLKKRIKSTTNTRMLCFHPYFNVKKNYSLCSNCIYLFWSIFQCSKKRIHS